jgi:hypothetical protein
MKKNYYKIISAICLICGFTSCGDFLEIKDQREIILEDFWNEKADVDNIVAGCYSALQNDGVRKRMMIWGEFRSDNIGSGSNIDSDISLQNILKENITAKNDYTTWEGFYDVINRCNTVLKYAPEVSAKDPAYTDGDLKATIAEVTALRSLSYFYLIRAFRDVPFSREAFTDDDQKMDLEATPFSEVLNNIIADLEAIQNNAVRRYPETKNGYQTGRITQDAIHAMLCEMYLWAGDYDNCIKYADMVIKSKKELYEEYNKKNRNNMSSSDEALLEKRLNGFPLVYESLQSVQECGRVYKTLFTQNKREDASREVIFELFYDEDPSAHSAVNNAAISSLYGNSNSKKGLVTAGSSVSGDINLTSGRLIFEDKVKALDARMYTSYDQAGEAIAKFVYPTININAESSTPNASYREAYSQSSNGSHWVIYRLPDIMLFKAEALCMKMRDGVDTDALAYNTAMTDEAFSLVNAINKRSIMKVTFENADTLSYADYKGSKSAMLQLVKKERRREFLFEGKYWFDLVRYCMRAGNTDEIITAVSNRDDVNSQFASNFFKKMDAIFWPYNYEELKVNHNLVQNPAFGSGENSSYEKTTK